MSRLMFTFTPEEDHWLYHLQRPWPLTVRPLETFAQQLNTTEAQLEDFLHRLREAGIVRRIGGVFDARRLGYRSSLFAIKAEGEALQEAAQEVAALSGATHVYMRGWPEAFTVDGLTTKDYEDYPNLWYTLSAPHPQFESIAEGLKRWQPQAFPAIRRFKIDVVFDTRTQGRDERTEYVSPQEVQPMPLPSGEAQALVRRYQDDTVQVTEPFLEDDLPQLRRWQEEGVMRRFALLLRHRKTGFTANAMCCWAVGPTELNTMGRRLAQSPDVTHCYARPPAQNFPFNLYAMIHKQTWEEAYQTFQRLAREAQLPETGKVFFSTHEFKKTSLRCFV